MAVVKANAYGHGDVQVAKTALEAGASYLAVAFLDEALALRKGGIDAPILVLGASRPSDINIAAKHRITLTVFQAEWIEQAADFYSETAPVLFHLKMDTGMGRLGVKEETETKRLIEQIDRHPYFSLEGVYTHFATADEINTGYFLFNTIIFYGCSNGFHINRLLFIAGTARRRCGFRIKCLIWCALAFRCMDYLLHRK